MLKAGKPGRIACAVHNMCCVAGHGQLKHAEMQRWKLASGLFEVTGWQKDSSVVIQASAHTYPFPEALALQAKLLVSLQKCGMCSADECGRRSADSRKVAVRTVYACQVGVEAGVAVLVSQTSRTLHTRTAVNSGNQGLDTGCNGDCCCPKSCLASECPT